METDKDMKPRNALAEIAEVLKNESAPSTDSLKKKAIEHFGEESWKRHVERKGKFLKASLIISELAKFGNAPIPLIQMRSILKKCREIAEKK